MASFAKEDITVSQLRAVDYELALRIGQLVAKCADEVLDDTEDPLVRQKALVWRMYAAPQARTAAFNQDPLAGLIALWALSGQQKQYFSEGEGHGPMVERHACVAETSNRLYDDVTSEAVGVMGDERAHRMKARVDEWVEAHPIEGELHVRPTAQADLAALVGGDLQGGLKAVGTIDETFRDLNDRVAMLSSQLPTEARWQVDYLVAGLFEEYVAKPSEEVVESMSELVTIFVDFEDLLTEQTSRLLAGFERERKAIAKAIDEERVLVFESIGKERVAFLDSIEEQIDQALDRFEETGQGLIDHFFERLIGVFIGIALFLSLLVVVLVVALRPRTRAPGARPESQDESTKIDRNG